MPRAKIVSKDAGISEEMQRCIDDCLDCRAVCLETVTHCLGMGGEHAGRDHVVLLLDCADICQTATDFMLRGSRLHVRTCAVCAEVCDRCAAECERFGDDEVMRACADACRRCAESCRAMARAA